MSQDMAMKILGLSRAGNKTKQGHLKKLEDYSEDDILHSFQEECALLGQFYIINAFLEYNLNSFQFS